MPVPFQGEIGEQPTVIEPRQLIHVENLLVAPGDVVHLPDALLRQPPQDEVPARGRELAAGKIQVVDQFDRHR